MTPTDITMSLSIGGMTPAPVSEEVALAVQSVSVTMSEQAPCAFQINFNAERSVGLVGDYPLLRDAALEPFNRVVIKATIGSATTILIDGFITHQQLVPGDAGRGGTLTVTGEDVSVLMEMVDAPVPYPALGDAAIVAMVLGKWSMIGIEPMIIPPAEIPENDPEVSTTIQNGTDRAYLNALAANYGYVFGVRPGPVELVNIAYWGPPLRLSDPQPALTVDMGPATNVTSLDIAFDAMAPTLILGTVEDPISDAEIPVATLLSTRQPPLATTPALTASEPFGRKRWYENSSFTTVRAFAEAQGQTDVSTDDVVTVTGTLDAVRYGSVLRAPGLVGLRGAGSTYDGLYYVKTVTHQLAPGSYTQQFTLTREGTGSTVQEVVT